MKFSKQLIILTTLIAAATIPVIANATNGYFLIGFGSKSRAMGGTGVANNTGGMAAAFNPATMIDSGNEFDIGAEFFIPPRSVTHQSSILGYTDERSNHDIFLIPSMGATYQLNSDLAVGFAFIGAGLKTEYDQSSDNSSCNQVNAGQVPGFAPGNCPPTFYNPNISVQPAPEAGVELVQMQIVPSIAYKVNKNHTLGASVVIGAQFFRAEGLEAFEDLGFTSSPGFLTGKNWDHSFGGGYRLGWLMRTDDGKLRIGLNYSSRVWMDEFEQYKNLFAEQGDFDIPENFAVGLSYDFTPSWTMALDIQRINWSDVKSVGNPGPATDAANVNAGNLFGLCPVDPTPCLLGGSKGLGFGWQSRNVYKIGVDWQYNEKINLRVGWNYGKSPIPETEVLFNMLAPATPEHHLTFGGGYLFTENVSLDANVMIAFINTIKGPTAFSPTGGPVAPGSTNASIAMGQYSLGATLGIKF
jgi:long-chain fatty acid transport protein